jgi:antitoxin (DNA-binding transcriptional repressor) of toxin-antitoxin stability system
LPSVTTKKVTQEESSDARSHEMEIKVGAYEAKAKLPELLRQVRAGKRFTITNRRHPVAEPGPPSSLQRPDAKAAIEAFKAYRIAHPVGHPINIRGLIEEGRE